MTICKNCKHNKIVKYPFTNKVPIVLGDYCMLILSWEWETAYADLECCTLNPMTGADDMYDKDFKGNISFNCGGFDALP